MAKKMTIVEMYGAIVEKAKGVLSKEEIEFLQSRADLVAKKNATRKPTKAQAENEEIKDKILEFMSDKVSRTVTDIIKESGLVVRTESKGKAYFTLA